MNRLAGALEGDQGWAPVSYVRIDGDTDGPDRLAATRRFASDPSIRAALLSVTAAGVGLDFSAASAVVFVELPGEVRVVWIARDQWRRRYPEMPSVDSIFSGDSCSCTSGCERQ